jgi:DNA-directed RNA polymerase subunit RPC12/RpoP
MPVSPCPDCGREVSTEEANCPHCGRLTAARSRKAFKRVETWRPGIILEAIGFVASVAGIITFFFSIAGGAVLLFLGFVVFLVGRFI